MEFEQIIFPLRGIISFLIAQAVPMLFGALVALILREYGAWKVNLRNERIQKYEKLIEKIYGPLKVCVIILEKACIPLPGAFDSARWDEQIEKIEKLFSKYAHEINPTIMVFYNALKKGYDFSQRDGIKVEVLEKISELVRTEYGINVSNLDRYRKMREGFWKNLWFYVNPFIFRSMENSQSQ